MKPLPLLAILLAAQSLRAQSPAPDDAVRRAFPREAAGVIAWLRGFKGDATAEPGGRIVWRDATGKAVRERTVKAPTGDGAAWFREVFRQLAGDDWALPSAPPDNSRATFWQGADLAASSQGDALAVITKLLAEKPRPPRAADAARLAGAHVQTASPLRAETPAPDPALLARGAAWLAAAEAHLREPLDAAWAPILFLEGRKAEAVEVWKASSAKTPRASAEKAWDLILAGPRPTVTTTPPPDFTDPDKAWAYLRELEQPPRGADSPEDQLRRIRLWLNARRSAAEKYRAAFPDDPRRWDAAIIACECASELLRTGDRSAQRPSPDVLDEILAASDASETTKGDAAFFRVMLAGDDVMLNSPHTLPPFHRALAGFIERYPQHRRAPQAASLQLQLLEATETPGADKLLASLAAHPNAAIAQQAKAMIERRARFAELKKMPLELKFTATDGSEVDAAKLRGKVVLLDFWASWCGPCLAEAPHVAAAFQKLHDRGFEIIGINLDEDKTAMESAMKRTGMTWPQHHDGRGWQNEIAQRFGIRAIPATWLFDKQGKLREVGLRGAELETAVERLLRAD